jgi:hypothetical protein
MSERDSVNDGIAFIELIDRETEQELDPGIRLFDGTMQETEEFINDDGGVVSPRAEQAFSDLNDNWKFHRDIASVTGRLYLVDRVLKDHMAEEWGEPLVDEDGELYFMVDDVELRSQGIVRGPHDYAFNDVESLRNRIRFGYGFSLPRDDYGMHQFVLYHGEAYKHVYGTPSAEAIDLRLHRDYPEVMELVDQLIKEGEREAGKLPKRLELLTRRIQSELVASEDLREWLASYLDQRIAFDERWSVALTMQGPVTFIDEDGDALSLDIKSPHTEHTFAPEVAFVMRDNDGQPIVHAAFIANLPHPADENYTEQAIIPVTSVTSLRNTRRTTNLVTIAMNARYANEPEEHSTKIEEIPEPPEKDIESSERLKQLRRYQNALDEFVNRVRQARRRYEFSSEESAHLASQAICEEMAPKLQSADAHGIMVHLRGPSVQLPNMKLSMDAERLGLNLQFDSAAPFVSPESSDEFVGKLGGIYAGVDVIEHEDGSSSYLPIPKLTFVVGETPIELGSVPIPTVEGGLVKSAIVRMDSFETLKVAQLELIDEFRESRREFKASYPRHRLNGLIDDMSRMEMALSRDETGYTSLDKISVLRSISRVVAAEPEIGSNALVVLSKMLKMATAKVTGDAHYESRVIPDFELHGSIESIVEHVPDTPDSGAAFVVHVKHERGVSPYYVPLRTVTSFLY